MKVVFHPQPELGTTMSNVQEALDLVFEVAGNSGGRLPPLRSWSARLASNGSCMVQHLGVPSGRHYAALRSTPSQLARTGGRQQRRRSLLLLSARRGQWVRGSMQKAA